MSRQPQAVQIKELIDTLWNVNTNSTEKISSPAPELIDTLWNVNLFFRLNAFLNSRINRYIMECKCISEIESGSASIELIDTLWNVNERSN